MDIYSYKSFYGDRTQPDWVRVLPIPGRALQSAELLEMQSIWMQHLKQAVGSIYRSGTALSGLRVIDTNAGTGEPDYYVTPGTIVVDGIVLAVPGKRLGVLSVDKTHKVSVAIAEKVITELEDPSLRNNTGSQPGETAYGLEGAHRLVWTAEVVLDAPGYQIAEVSNGSIVQPPILNSLQSAMDIISIYTYERSGNFCVRGCQVAHSYSIPGSAPLEGIGKELKEAIALMDIDLSNKTLDLASTTSALSNATDSSTIAQLKALKEQLSFQVEQLNSDLSSLKAQLSNYPQPKAAMEVFTVSPGLVYILGYRLDRPHPESISIPRQAYKKEAISSRFIYSAPIYRLQVSVSGDGKSFLCFISGLKEIPTIAVEVNTVESTADDLLDLFVEGFRNDLEAVKFTSPGYTSPSLRILLTSSLAVTRVSDSTVAFRLLYPSALVSVSFQGEGLTFSPQSGYLMPSVNLSPIDSYELAVKPVASITRVVADLIADSLPITRSNNGDYLGDDTVLSLIRVEQGRTLFVEGRDYSLNGNNIFWYQTATIAPPIGTTYYVSFTYTQPLTPNEDYALSNNSIRFLSRRPYPGGTFTVDYEYYVGQVGVIYIDAAGGLGYQLSNPSTNPTPPTLSDSQLPLALIKMKGDAIEVEEFTYRRFTASELYDLVALYNRVNSNPLTPLDRLDLPFCEMAIKSPHYPSVTARSKTIPLKYLGGGQLTRYESHLTGVTVPLSSSYPSREILLESQPRITSYTVLNIQSQPYIELSPRIIFTSKAYNSLKRIPLETLSQSYEDALNYGVAPFSKDHPEEVEIQFTIMGYCLEDISYSLFINKKQVGFQVINGYTTSIGVRPIDGSLKVIVNTLLVPGTHSIEFVPAVSSRLAPSSSVSVFNTLDLLLGKTPPYAQGSLMGAQTVQPQSLVQTLSVRRVRLLWGVGLYIRQASPDISIHILLRDEETKSVLSKGYPDRLLYSQNGSAMTGFEFTSPVVMYPDVEYGIAVVLTKGDIQLYTAKLGERDLIGGQINYLGYQVYNGGHLYLPGYIEAFEEDLAYSLLVSEYLTEPVTLLLGEYGTPDLFASITGFGLCSRDICPQGTQIVYEYSLPFESGWRQFNANSYIPLSSPTDRFSIRATLFTSSKFLAPSLSLEGSAITLYSESSTGTLQSKPIEVLIQSKLSVSVTWRGQGKVKLTVSGEQVEEVTSINTNGSVKSLYQVIVLPGVISYQVTLYSDRNLATPPYILELTDELLPA